MLYWPFYEQIEVRGRWWRRGGPRSVGFASARGGGRLHAACDLLANRNTLIRAVAGGNVLSYRHFYEGTWALVVHHQPEGMEPFIIRYGEVLGPDGGISWANGQEIVAGNDIAKVGQLRSGASMLHFELYASTQWPYPSLSMSNRWRRAPDSYSHEEIAAIQAEGHWHCEFQRRLDLADPTDFLLALRDGRTPPQPVPVNQAQQIVQMEELHIAPGDRFRREQLAIERARQEQIRRVVREYQRVHGLRFRMPGPNGLDLESGIRRALEEERRRWLDMQRRIQLRELLQAPGPHGIESDVRAPIVSDCGADRYGPD